MHFIYGSHTIWPIICMAIIWLILIVIGVLLVRNFINGTHKPNSVLKIRLPKGEMDKEKLKHEK